MLFPKILHLPKVKYALDRGLHVDFVRCTEIFSLDLGEFMCAEHIIELTKELQRWYESMLGINSALINLGTPTKNNSLSACLYKKPFVQLVVNRPTRRDANVVDSKINISKNAWDSSPFTICLALISQTPTVIYKRTPLTAAVPFLYYWTVKKKSCASAFYSHCDLTQLRRKRNTVTMPRIYWVTVAFRGFY